MDLLILESPNKVKDVKKYAGSLGFSCAVIATSGHLLDLPPMADGPSVDIATMAPSKLQPRDPRAAEQCARIKDAICHASRVIVATDPDREGEAIAAQVWPWIPKGKAWRATFEEITQAGIKRGLDAMQPRLHDSAVDAALARRVVDRLAGWHATSVVFEKLRRKGVSAGRLQSAALRLVVDRYRENTAFVASSTYGVRIRLRTSDGVEFTARLLEADNTARVFSTRAEAEASPKPKTGVVRKIEATEKQQRPRPPFERDDGGFVVPGSVWIRAGAVEVNREFLNAERVRALEVTGDPQAAVPYVWAELQALGGSFFAEASMDDFGNMPEVRELGATWDQLESMSIEDLASLVVDHATSEAVPVAA